MSLARRIAASVLCALPLAAAIALLTEPRPAPAQIPGTANIQVGGTNILGGTSGRCLFNNAGKVGETASCGLAGGITVGTSVITGGTNTRVLYDNAGVLGEYTNAQLTSLVTALPNSQLANVATSTFKGRTTAGTGSPEDLTAAQAAAILGAVGGVLKSKIISATYDLTTASGAQSITGCGFAPTAAVILTNKNASTQFSVGMVDSGFSQATIEQFSDVAQTVSNGGVAMQYINSALTASQSGTVSLAADGVSIAWVKAGAPSGTLNEFVLCLR